jgi:hypothetical protein
LRDIKPEELKYNGFIKQLSNGIYVCVSKQNSLLFFGDDLKTILEIKDCQGTIISLWEGIYYFTKNAYGNKKIQLYVCCKFIFYSIEIDFDSYEFTSKPYKLETAYCDCFFELRKNCYIIIGSNETNHFINLFKEQKNQKKQITISQNNFHSGYKITDNIIVLASNSVLTNGQDIIKFYNSQSKKYSKTIENYSPTVTQSGFSLLLLDKAKILLVPCKKYSEGQNNGILLINAQIGDNIDIGNPFYDTKSFQVYCFCQIYLILDNFSGECVSRKETNYFLAGGFEQDKRDGAIRLYKIFNYDKINLTEIKYLQDIVFENDENFVEFEGPINSMIQSNTSGLILATCYNGKLYEFTIPNIDYYLNE